MTPALASVFASSIGARIGGGGGDQLEQVVSMCVAVVDPPARARDSASWLFDGGGELVVVTLAADKLGVVGEQAGHHLERPTFETWLGTGGPGVDLVARKPGRDPFQCCRCLPEAVLGHHYVVSQRPHHSEVVVDGAARMGRLGAECLFRSDKSSRCRLARSAGGHPGRVVDLGVVWDLFHRVAGKPVDAVVLFCVVEGVLDAPEGSKYSMPWTIGALASPIRLRRG
jgi:hypothetical protein